jgi:hypothetical protein
MIKEEISNLLTIEKQYKENLIFGVLAFEDLFGEKDTKSLISLLNTIPCINIIKKSEQEDIPFFPMYLLKQAGNYSENIDKIPEENISEESFRKYLKNRR